MNQTLSTLLPYIGWIVAGGFALGAGGIFASVHNTRMKIKNGYPLEGMWGQSLKPEITTEAMERVKLLTQENAGLRAELKARDKFSLYVANAVSPASQLHTDILALLRHALGSELSAYRIHADTGIPEALARNQSFHLAAPHSQAAHDLQGLASWLSSWIKQASRASAQVAGGAP